MSVKSLKILGLCSALFIPATAPYAASSQNKDIAQLLVQGHFWYSRGRADLTEKAWKKVLLAEPNNIEALSGLEELSHYNPEDIDRNKLRLARELARQHRYEEALTAYQDAFRGKPPTSFYTAEYFETLSGTQNGWLTALEGLQELTATYPSNPRYQLALGRVNTYREKTRHTGIEQLASVAVEPGINEKIQQAAIDSWRDALLWLPNDPASKSQMKAFLEVVPDDPAVLQKIALAPAGIPAGNSEAYAILEQGKLSQAARLFKKVLKSQPDNADALAGLGITRFRQRRFASAARKLQQALKRAPGKQQDLQPLLNDARYWAKYRRAEKARKNGEYAKAERLGQALLNLRPTQVEGQLLRARIFAEQGQFYQAADAYQQILESHPRNTQAKRGLVDALIKEDPAQALALVSQYGLSEVDYQKERDKLDATRLQEQSKAETDPAVALTLLEKAHQLTPHDPWITLDLARRYQAANRQHEAHALLDTLVSNNPGDRDARYAKAIFHTEAKEWQSGLQAITKIPATLRTPDQQRLEQRLWGLSQRQQAATLMAAGADDEALLIAKSMRERSEENPELGLLYADLLLDLGQTEAGIAAADNAMDLLSSADANLNIQYASLLLKSRQLAKLKAQLLELKFNDTLDPQQRESVTRLAFGAALTEAEQQRQAGQPDQAYLILKPYLEQFGENISMQMALAAIYQDTGDTHLALKLYQQIAAQEPDNIDAETGAFGAAMTLRNYSLAEEISSRAIQKFPEKAEFLAQRARLRLLRGERQQAFEDFSKAVNDSSAHSPESSEAFPPPSGKLSSSDEEPEWLHQARITLANLEDANHDFINMNLSLRDRNGTNGLDELQTLSIPVTYKHVIDLDQSVFLQARYVSLDADTLSPDSTAQLGSLILSPPAATRGSLQQKDKGVAIGLRYEGKNWSGDIGSTPIGFTIENTVGSIGWKQQHLETTVEAELSRRAVTETLLSYAGTTDPATGKAWGGVTSTGLRGKLSKDEETRGYFGELEYRILRGDSVADNDQIKAQGGIYWKPDNVSKHALQLGANVMYQHFDKNLRFFTVGHGGYFSPQDYFSINLPVDYKQQSEQLSYQLGAQLGLQWFKEDNAERFPGQPDLRSVLENNNAVNGNPTDGYNGQNETALTYALKGNLEYAFTQQLSLGGWFAATKSNNYKESGGGIYLRYYTAPRTLKNASPEINTYSEVW